MKKTAVPALIIVTATLSACGSNFEWFPKTADTTAPTVTATIAGNSIFSNHTTHVPLASLPTNAVVFSATEAATIYYTTNGTEPTTASSSVSYVSSAVSGPILTLALTTLKFFGVDNASNTSATVTGTIKAP